MTSAYYANRYFGEDKTVEVNHLFWNQLKRSGKVLLEREKESGEARWVPVVVTPKLHNVRHHKQEEEDLSYIKEEK
ncbi:hypothetical protein AGDE_12906 [Angomonas deanei]|uniref:Uncharacterized protein n=1 Tax=Angomonas deanei TaxID=59799 RepID=A0A7G2C0N4_9TRYP|nr:hypothetical protein AGDE_12906 [Angomonas deanei]CAD2213290.1 hypothetical protein, conserved [Angomonas deanei]|eukprot:EPY23378.1 hypothetical protein AGDE_12906 [Angomonas deanei]